MYQGKVKKKDKSTNQLKRHGGVMKIENKIQDSDFIVACMFCGTTKDLHLKAHRNKEQNITGFIYSCGKCDLKDVQFGIWDEKTGEEII